MVQMSSKKFNRAAVDLQLDGAKVALDKCIHKVSSGDCDDESPLVMAIDFEQVLYHLCLAWHSQFRTEEELARQTSEEYIELSNIVPNFGFNLTLMPGIDCEGEILGRKFNRTAVKRQLSGAKVALDECIHKVNSGNYDEEATLTMAIDFEQVLYHLCLAWHFKHMTDEERGSLSQEEFNRLSKTVPNFGFELKLMSGIDPEVER
jgi:hypothetical protein